MTIAVGPAEIAAFAQINAHHPRYMAYLAAERAEAVAFMVQSLDPIIIHRSQGKVAFIDEHIKLLVSANKLLHPTS